MLNTSVTSMPPENSSQDITWRTRVLYRASQSISYLMNLICSCVQISIKELIWLYVIDGTHHSRLCGEEKMAWTIGLSSSHSNRLQADRWDQCFTNAFLPASQVCACQQGTGYLYSIYNLATYLQRKWSMGFIGSCSHTKKSLTFFSLIDDYPGVSWHPGIIIKIENANNYT